MIVCSSLLVLLLGSHYYLCKPCKEPLRGLTAARLEPPQSDDYGSHSHRQQEDVDGDYNDMSDEAILDWIEREGAFYMFCCDSVAS